LGFVNNDNTGQAVTVTGKVVSAEIAAEELTVEFLVGDDVLGSANTNLTVIGEIITIGSRRAMGTLWGHLSIERWKPNCSSAELRALKVGKQYTTAELAGYELDDAWELLNNGVNEGGWGVDVCPPDADPTRVPVNVSVIVPLSTATEHVVVLQKADVTTEWDSISEKAGAYEYAEQTGFNGNFQHWPESRYMIWIPGTPPHVQVNNSNTFIQWLCSQTDVDFIDPPVRNHPGSAEPADVGHPYENVCDEEADPYQVEE